MALNRASTRPHYARQFAKAADRSEEKFFGCAGADEQSTLKHLLQKLTEVHQFSDLPID